MFCPRCGTQNSDDAVHCSCCGSLLKFDENSNMNSNGNMPPQFNQQNQRRMDIPNHLVWSILTTLFCCMPLGIAAIVYSSKVDTKLAMGDYEGALNSSKTARNLCIIALACGAAIIIIYILLFIILGVSTLND